MALTKNPVWRQPSKKWKLARRRLKDTSANSHRGSNAAVHCGVSLDRGDITVKGHEHAGYDRRMEPMQLIDTHVHINFDRFDTDRLEVVTRWRDAGVVQLVHSCVSPGEFTSIARLAEQLAELYFAVGLHPLEQAQWTCSEAEKIKYLAQSNPKVVAIGETGLDFYKADNYEQQKTAFAAQLAIAQKLELPVIIHCRDAAVQTAVQLQAAIARGGKLRGVMHCWGGTPAETQWFLDLGLYISFSGTVTFKKAIEIKESCKIVPDDRLLIETDCPFLAPVPKRGKRNEPAYVRHVASEVAKLRGVSSATVAAQTTDNARKLFRLPEIVPEQSGQIEKGPRGRKNTQHESS